MSTFYINSSQIHDGVIEINGEDVSHIKNVLRYHEGDELEVCDDKANRYLTKIKCLNNASIELEVLNLMDKNTESSICIDLYQGLPKSDKMELIIQKGTEIGIKSFIPIITDRVIVKLDEKNESKKIERWQKIAKEAAMQSGRQSIPVVEKAINLQNSIENLSKYDIVIVPYECEKDKLLKDVLKGKSGVFHKVAVVIGPEGGFSSEDINYLTNLGNSSLVSLGPRILRTETAGLVTASNIIYELDS